MYFLLKIGIFHCYVSLPDGNHLVLAESMSFGESHDFGEPNVKENTLADLIIAQKSVGQPQQKERSVGLKVRIFTLHYIDALIFLEQLHKI